MGARLLDENIVIHVARASGRPTNEVCKTLSFLIDQGVGESDPGKHTTCVGGSPIGPLLGMDHAQPASLKRTFKAAPDMGLRLARHLQACSSETERRSLSARTDEDQRAVTAGEKTCIRNAYAFEDLYGPFRSSSTTLPPPEGTADKFLVDLLDADPDPVAFLTEDLGPDTHTRRQVTVIADHSELEDAMLGNVQKGVPRPAVPPMEAAANFLVGRLRRSGLAVGGGR